MVRPPPGLGDYFCNFRTATARSHKRGNRPSPAKQRQDAQRSSAYKPMGTVLASAIKSILVGREGVLNDTHTACSTAGSVRGRHRDLYPLPLLGFWPEDVRVPGTCMEAALSIANACILSLNALWCDVKVARVLPPRNRPTAPQQEVHNHVVNRTARLLSRLSQHQDQGFPWCGMFNRFEQARQPRYEELRGDAVDLPQKAATCDPLVHLPFGLREAVSHPATIFPDQADGIPSDMGSEQATDRREYIALVVRGLQCGKLRLRRDVRGIAPVFAAQKAEGRQRKIWNGSRLSQLAVKPPKPERLASPSVFLDMHVRQTEALFYSKRDAETFFDVLQVPLELQTWFGQEAVHAAELCSAGKWTLLERARSSCGPWGSAGHLL